jgi:predicted transcriptional regulator
MNDSANLTAELHSLRAQRDRASREIASIDHRLGQVAAELLTEEYSKSHIARIIGVSHTHVQTLIERAEGSTLLHDDAWSTPTMTGRAAVEYLRSTRTHVARVVAAFEASDVLFESRLHPEAFEQGAGLPLLMPHMLWQLNDANWLAIEEVNVGYGGTGGTYALRALEDAGIPSHLAQQIASYRFSTTDIEAGEVSGQVTWPRYPSATNLSPQGGAYVVCLGRDALASVVREDLTGFYPSVGPNAPLQQWIDFLDGDCPDWMKGDRVARVFLSANEARRQGFVGRFGSGASVYTLIVEQGEFQMWVPVYGPIDGGYNLSSEMYEALRIADLYPADLAERDSRSRFWRFLDQVRHVERPAFVDVSRNGQGVLRCTPANPDR